MDEARECLNAGNDKKALAIGKNLEKLRYSGAFEIQALAHMAIGKTDKAIEVLEKGTKLVPDIWLLWQLLGNCRSDCGQFARSQDAYEKGLALKNADAVSLLYNYARMLWRSEKFAAAEEKIGLAFEKKNFAKSRLALIARCTALQLDLHNKGERHGEAEASFKSFLKRNFRTEDNGEDLAPVYAAFGATLLATGKSAEAADMALLAIRLDRHNADARYLLREIRSASPYRNAKYLRILISGHDPAPRAGHDKPLGFFTTYDVVADDEGEALRFIKEFEAPHIAGSLAIEEIETIKSPKQPKGVYETTPYNLFPLDSE